MYKAILRPFFFLFDPEKIHHFVFKLIRFSNAIPGVAAINKMMIDVEGPPTTIEKTSKVLINGDIMKIDQTSVTIKIDNNPFISSDQPNSYSKDI